MALDKAILLYLCITELTRATQFLSVTPAANVQVKDVAVSSDGRLYATGIVNDQYAVYRLNCSLVTQEELKIDHGLSVLGLTLTPDDSFLGICTSDKTCSAYNATNLKSGSVILFPNALASNTSVAVVGAKVKGGGNSFYVASSNETVNLIGQFGVDRNVSRSSGGLFSAAEGLLNRTWFGGFVSGSYAYFLVLDVNASRERLKLVRVCDNSQETTVSSVSEIELDCIGDANGYVSIVGTSVVTYPVNGPGSYDTVVLIGITTQATTDGYTGMYRSRVCAYRLSEVDSAINTTSTFSCFSGPNSSYSPCNATGGCNGSSPGETKTPSLSATSYPLHVPLTNASFQLDYVLCVYTESVTLLFVASTNNKNDSVLQAFHVTNGTANDTGKWFSSWALPQRATKLTWSSGQNHVYVMTNNSIIQVPIEQCSNFSNCQSCAANVNPLCGWCHSEQKCSRSSQCQNGTLTGYWLQNNSSLCQISTSTTMTPSNSSGFKFVSVFPTYTILAGGINLFFSGTFPNTTQRAFFVAINENTSSECEQEFGRLRCLTPPLTSYGDIIISSIYLTPGDNYTVVADGVPGPIGEMLKIEVLPNPIIQFINENDRTQIVGSVKALRITGFYIKNVDVATEIRVSVGGETCEVDVQATSGLTLACQPPQFQSLRSSINASVRVTIGKNLVNTPIPGYITLLATNEATSTFPVAAAVGGGVAGLFFLLLLVLAIPVVLMIHRWSSLHHRKQTPVLMAHLLVESNSKITDLGDPELADLMKQYRGVIIPSSSIQVLNAIGNGEFGVVYKARLLHEKTNIQEIVALKTLKGLFTMNDLLGMMNEILKMQDFHHPHVMTLLGMSFDASHTPSMVMPFMANGSLLSYLKGNRPLLLIADTTDVQKLQASQKLLTTICYQVAQGMEYLASKKFVHRDLAARNCMIDADGVVKVGDFGLSEDVYISGYFRVDKESKGVKLPFKWLAPESFRDGVFNEKTDVWSFGVTCWEIFSVGAIPYPGLDASELPTFLKTGRRMEKPDNVACSETMYSLILRCWDSDPEERPPFSKIATIISKALQVVSDYLDLSMKATMTTSILVKGAGLNNLGADTDAIQTSVCEAYGVMPGSSNSADQATRTTSILAEGTGLNNLGADTDAIQTSVCKAYGVMPGSSNSADQVVADNAEPYVVIFNEEASSPGIRYIDCVMASGGMNSSSELINGGHEYI